MGNLPILSCLINLVLQGWRPDMIYMWECLISITGKSILHIYFYQTEKHICKNFENMWQVKIFYIYIFFNQQNIYVKSVWNLWQMNIYYISITKIRINICKFVLQGRIVYWKYMGKLKESYFIYVNLKYVLWKSDVFSIYITLAAKCLCHNNYTL